MASLVAHVHHDLPLVLEGVNRLLESPQLRIRQIERYTEHRLLVRAAPFVGQVADRPELPEPTPLQLLVELADVAFNRGPLNPEAELADLFPENAADLGIQGLESDHFPIITASHAAAETACALWS